MQFKKKFTKFKHHPFHSQSDKEANIPRDDNQSPISADDANADMFGKIYCVGLRGLKSCYFTLHNTRLSYFKSWKDHKERGFIDLTGYQILEVNHNAKCNSIIASSCLTGKGKYLLKLVPPRSESESKNMKTRYIVFHSKQYKNNWKAALMNAADSSSNTISSSSSSLNDLTTPDTVSTSATKSPASESKYLAKDNKPLQLVFTTIISPTPTKRGPITAKKSEEYVVKTETDVPQKDKHTPSESSPNNITSSCKPTNTSGELLRIDTPSNRYTELATESQPPFEIFNSFADSVREFNEQCSTPNLSNKYHYGTLNNDSVSDSPRIPIEPKINYTQTNTTVDYNPSTKISKFSRQVSSFPPPTFNSIAQGFGECMMLNEVDKDLTYDHSSHFSSSILEYLNFASRLNLNDSEVYYPTLGGRTFECY